MYERWSYSSGEVSPKLLYRVANFGTKDITGSQSRKLICGTFIICIYSNKILTGKIDVIIHKRNRLCQINDLFTSFNVLYLCQYQSKINSVLKDNTHPLSSLVGFSERSGKPLVIKCRLERYRNSFLPRAVKLLRIIKYLILGYLRFIFPPYMLL